jgi:hypothetical protein
MVHAVDGRGAEGGAHRATDVDVTSPGRVNGL